jgi:hypothetical protein
MKDERILEAIKRLSDEEHELFQEESKRKIGEESRERLRRIRWRTTRASKWNAQMRVRHWDVRPSADHACRMLSLSGRSVL